MFGSIFSFGLLMFPYFVLLSIENSSGSVYWIVLWNSFVVSNDVAFGLFWSIKEGHVCISMLLLLYGCLLLACIRGLQTY